MSDRSGFWSRITTARPGSVAVIYLGTASVLSPARIQAELG
jgi:hypothetical protein